MTPKLAVLSARAVLEARRFSEPGRDDDRLPGNAVRVAHHRTDVHSEPQLEAGRLALGAIMPFQGGGKLTQQLIKDFRRGYVRRHHGQEAVAAILGSRIWKALHGLLRHPEQRFSD